MTRDSLPWPFLLASGGVPGQRKPRCRGAVTTPHVCNLRYRKCFVSCQGLAAVPITHRAICQRLFLGTSQCSKSLIHPIFQTCSELFGAPPLPHFHLPYINLCGLCFGPECTELLLLLLLRWSLREVSVPHPLGLTYSL